MTIVTVSKKSLLKSGYVISAQTDGVVVLDNSGAMSYIIDSTNTYDTSCQVSGLSEGADTSMVTLLADCQAAFPALFD